MASCVKQRPQHISASSCLEGGLGKCPSKHRKERIENDQVGHLCTKHRTSAWNDMQNNYERDNQWLSILTQVLFLSHEFGKGQEEKPSSKSGLDFSKTGFRTSSYTSLSSSNTKTLRPID